jgi:hypothetical protein
VGSERHGSPASPAAARGTGDGGGGRVTRGYGDGDGGGRPPLAGWEEGAVFPCADAGET